MLVVDVPELLKITGNTNSRHFTIINYDKKREWIDLLANSSVSLQK